MDNYQKELENNMLELIRQKEESDKHLLTFEYVIGALSVIILFLPIVIAAFLPMQDWQRLLLTLSGFPPFLVGIFFALKIEQVAGYYECRHCKHRYIPIYRKMVMAPHMGTTRYMKCPKCQKKSWQKKVIQKK